MDNSKTFSCFVIYVDGKQQPINGASLTFDEEKAKKVARELRNKYSDVKLVWRTTTTIVNEQEITF